MAPEPACVVIRATIVLHNKCIDYYGVTDDELPAADDDAQVQPFDNALQQQGIPGQIVRRQIVATHFNH